MCLCDPASVIPKRSVGVSPLFLDFDSGPGVFLSIRNVLCHAFSHESFFPFPAAMQRVQQLRPLLPKSMVTYYQKPLLITKGQMQFLFDSEGKKYLDMFGGIVTVSVGHCHP